MVAGREDVPTVLDALRRIVAFLRDTGAVPEADADALGAEIDRTAPEFTEVVAAVDSDERQAAAEVIAGLMQADGVSWTTRRPSTRGSATSRSGPRRSATPAPRSI